MKRRTLILAGSALASVSLGVTVTNATLVDTITTGTDFRVVATPESLGLATDPGTEVAESTHTSELEYENDDDDVASITADYDFGSDAASFDELNSDHVTVEFEQNGSLTTLTLDSATYSGATATFDINDDTTSEGEAKVTIGTGENGIENPASGTYQPTLTFKSDNGGTLTYENKLSIQDNDSGAVNIVSPTQDKKFTAVPDGQGNQFEIESVDIRDDDGDDDISEVNYEIREGGSNGTIVGQKSSEFTERDRYNPSGNPAVTIQPDSGYSITSGQTYTLTTTGQDTDGNHDDSSTQETA